MSGGVDSSTVAALLLEQGYDVIGITMELWRPDDSPLPSADAARVAAHLGIPHRVIDLRNEFRSDVMQYFIDEYQRGRTPNPCVQCNRRFKFGRLLEAARKNGAATLATGHYARLLRDEQGITHLYAGTSSAKDQSYFLSCLRQDQLADLLFPLGTLSKPEVREKARLYGLPVAEKSESQDVCFIPNNEYVPFLETEGKIIPSAGPFKTRDGRIVGRHEGIHRYTIGQRRGMGIAWSEPLYVLEMEPDTNVIIVGTRDELGAQGLCADGVNWIIPQDKPFTASCKIRYRHRPVPCTVIPQEGGQVEVRFNDPQAAVTPGQTVVFYHGDEVLGGAWIQKKL